MTCVTLSYLGCIQLVELLGVMHENPPFLEDPGANGKAHFLVGVGMRKRKEETRTMQGNEWIPSSFIILRVAYSFRG